jgi:hypothetical protein
VLLPNQNGSLIVEGMPLPDRPRSDARKPAMQKGIIFENTPLFLQKPQRKEPSLLEHGAGSRQATRKMCISMLSYLFYKSPNGKSPPCWSKVQGRARDAREKKAQQKHSNVRESPPVQRPDRTQETSIHNGCAQKIQKYLRAQTLHPRSILQTIGNFRN